MMLRKNEILLSARKQFAHRGFAGASLRDIASDARVSLTLLNHHFGSKAQLLAAVDESCAVPGVRRTAQLNWLMRDGSGSYSLSSILSAWVRADFAAAAEIDGDSLISFLARFAVQGEPESQELTERQDAAGELLIAGFQGCFPMASRRAAESAYLFASGATTRFLLGGPRIFGLSGTRELAKVTDGDEARLLASLLACVERALLMADPIAHVSVGQAVPTR